VVASPALADGKLYVPTTDGDLVVLAADGCGAATCSPLWQATTPGPIRQQPAVAGGVVFTGSADADGTVAAFDAAGCGAASCPSLWEAGTGSEVTGAPAVAAGRLYVGTNDGFLYSFGLP
jgi:outer membrane protein assembly factor BamB